MKRNLVIVVALSAIATSYLSLISSTAFGDLVGGDNGTTVDLLSIDNATATASSIATLDIASISGMTYDFDSNTLYGFDSVNNDVVSIDASTGTTTVVADLNFLMRALAYDTSTGKLFGVDGDVNQELYEIDVEAGIATQGVLISSNGGIQAMTFDNAGNLFAIDIIPDDFVQIDTTTGQQTFLLDLAPQNPPQFTGVLGVTYDPESDAFFAVNSLVGPDELLQITRNGSVYSAVPVGVISGSTAIEGLAINPVSSNPLGDLNCDGEVNLLDVDPFVLALSDAALYEKNFPNCDIGLADCNQDGEVNLLDVDPFVAILSGG